MYGNSSSFQATKDGTLRDIQNPIYGDTEHDSASGPQDQPYAIAKTVTSQVLLASDSLGEAERTKGQPRYDYGANGAAPEYATVETNPKDKEPQLYPGNETPSGK